VKKRERDSFESLLRCLRYRLAILVYRSVVLVGKICVDGEHHGRQDREEAGCHYSILVFLQVGANQISREIVPLAEQDDASGAAHDHAHRRENESLCRSERYPVSVGC